MPFCSYVPLIPVALTWSHTLLILLYLRSQSSFYTATLLSCNHGSNGITSLLILVNLKCSGTIVLYWMLARTPTSSERFFQIISLASLAPNGIIDFNTIESYRAQDRLHRVLISRCNLIDKFDSSLMVGTPKF